VTLESGNSLERHLNRRGSLWNSAFRPSLADASSWEIVEAVTVAAVIAAAVILRGDFGKHSNLFSGGYNTQWTTPLEENIEEVTKTLGLASTSSTRSLEAQSSSVHSQHQI
jgi:hypothetical protein